MEWEEFESELAERGIDMYSIDREELCKLYAKKMLVKIKREMENTHDQEHLALLSGYLYE